MDEKKAKTKSKIKPNKEMRAILKRINPDLKRLIELTDDPGEEESVFVDTVRSGARQLRIARRIAKNKGEPD